MSGTGLAIGRGEDNTLKPHAGRSGIVCSFFGTKSLWEKTGTSEALEPNWFYVG